MPARVSEALVLRTYPFREADLIVSFLTRDAGKLRGAARRARRPGSRFGAGLERLSHVRMTYFQRETRELVTLDTCELIWSPFDLAADYTTGVALDYMAEVTEQLLPPAEPNERFFRLLLAVLEFLRRQGRRRSLAGGRLLYLMGGQALRLAAPSGSTAGFPGAGRGNAAHAHQPDDAPCLGSHYGGGPAAFPGAPDRGTH
jgi:hypothetical protein